MSNEQSPCVFKQGLNLMKRDSNEMTNVANIDDANNVDVDRCDNERSAAAPDERNKDNDDVSTDIHDDKDNDDDDDEYNNDNDGDDDNNDDDNGVPIDRGWAWLISLGTSVIYLVGSIQFHVVSVLLLDIKTELDTSLSTLAIALSIGFFAYTITTQLSVHVLMNKVSVRTLSTFATTVNFILTLVLAVFPIIEVFMLVHPLKGAMQGLCAVPTLTLVGFYFRRHRAVAVGVAFLGCTAGSILVPPMTRFLKVEYGLQGCLLLIAGVEMHAVCSAMILRPLTCYARKHVPTVSEGTENRIRPKKNTANGGPQHEHVSAIDIAHAKSVGTEGITIISSASDIDINFLENNQDSDKHSGPGSSLLSHEVVGGKDRARSKICLKPPAMARSRLAHDVENGDALRGARRRKIRPAPARQGIHGDERIASSWSLMTESVLGSSLALGSSVISLGLNSGKPSGLSEEKHNGIRHGVCSVFRRVFYWNLLKKPVCVLILLNYTLVHGGSFTRTYLASYATTRGVHETEAAILLTITGATEIISLVVFARVADSKILRPHQIIGAASLCIGVATQFIPSFTHFVPLACMAAIHGFLSGIGISLNPILIVDLLGLEYLPKMLGLSSMVVNLALAAQFPVVGALVDVTGDTPVVFHYAGASYLLSFVMLFLNPFFQWLQTCRGRGTQ